MVSESGRGTAIVREIPGPAGWLEVLLDLPVGPVRAAAAVGHPHPLYGGTMHTKMVYHLAKGLARVGCAALRINFRGVGRSAGAFDEGRGELDDFRAALDFLATRHPGLPLWAAGASFGSWIAARAAATDPRVALLIAVAPPVNLADFSILKSCVKPKFFIHGEDDEIVPVRLVRALYAEVPEPKELAVIDAANHVFDGRAEEVADAVEDLLAGVAGPDGSASCRGGGPCATP